MGTATYRTIQVPAELVVEIERLIEANTLGYRSIAELVKEAIRLRIRDVRLLEREMIASR